MSKEGRRKLLIFMFAAAAVFLTAAVTGYGIGRFVDMKLEIRPFGSLVSFVLSYMTAWLILLQLRKRFVITKEDSSK